MKEPWTKRVDPAPFTQRYKWGLRFAGIYLLVCIPCNLLLLLRVDPLGWGEYNILRMIVYFASMPAVFILHDILRTFYNSGGWIILGVTAPMYFVVGQIVGYIVCDIAGHKTLEKNTVSKSKKILRWFSIALVIWILYGAVVSFTVVARRREFDTKSPDGKKEFYLNRPFYRRVIYGMMCPIGSYPEYSLYVRDIASGRSTRYPPRWTGTWSPDSRWIAYEGKTKNEPRLLLIDTNERKEYVIPLTRISHHR